MTGIHQAPCIYLSCHAHFNMLFTCILHSKYRNCICPLPLEQPKCFKINVMVSKYTAQGKFLLEINTSIWFCYMKKKNSLMEDKRNNETQRPHTCRNPKRHISLTVSLLLWCKIAAVRCLFVVQACDRGQAVRHRGSSM